MLTSMIAGAGLAQVDFDAPCVSIRWERQCVVVEWKASASSDEFRAAQVMSIKACEENHASRMLVDARNMKLGLVDDDRDPPHAGQRSSRRPIAWPGRSPGRG